MAILEAEVDARFVAGAALGTEFHRTEDLGRGVYRRGSLLRSALGWAVGFSHASTLAEAIAQ